MKLLVFSDSHGNVANMEDAVRREEPDQVLHLVIDMLPIGSQHLRDAGAYHAEA